MTCLLLSVGLFLLSLATDVFAVPTPASVEKSCAGDNCVNAAADDLAGAYSSAIWKDGKHMQYQYITPN